MISKQLLSTIVELAKKDVELDTIHLLVNLTNNDVVSYPQRSKRVGKKKKRTTSLEERLQKTQQSHILNNYDSKYPRHRDLCPACNLSLPRTWEQYETWKMYCNGIVRSKRTNKSRQHNYR